MNWFIALIKCINSPTQCHLIIIIRSSFAVTLIENNIVIESDEQCESDKSCLLKRNHVVFFVSFSQT